MHWSGVPSRVYWTNWVSFELAMTVEVESNSSSEADSQLSLVSFLEINELSLSMTALHYCGIQAIFGDSSGKNMETLSSGAWSIRLLALIRCIFISFDTVLRLNEVLSLVNVDIFSVFLSFRQIKISKLELYFNTSRIYFIISFSVILFFLESIGYDLLEIHLVLGVYGV